MGRGSPVYRVVPLPPARAEHLRPGWARKGRPWADLVYEGPLGPAEGRERRKEGVVPLMREQPTAVAACSGGGVVMVQSHLLIAHLAEFTARAALVATNLRRRAGTSCMMTCFLYWLVGPNLGTPFLGEQPRPLLARTLAPSRLAPAPADEIVCTAGALRAA